MSLTSWTEEEYGRIAIALRYPPSSRLVATSMMTIDADIVTGQLRARIERLKESDKIRALALCDEIDAAKRARAKAAGRSPDVTRVGDIDRDVAKGDAIRAAQIETLRDELAELCDFPKNPCADSGASTWGY